jgi:hypothetical protein
LVGGAAKGCIAVFVALRRFGAGLETLAIANPDVGAALIDSADDIGLVCCGGVVVSGGTELSLFRQPAPQTMRTVVKTKSRAEFGFMVNPRVNMNDALFIRYSARACQLYAEEGIDADFPAPNV